MANLLSLNERYLADYPRIRKISSTWKFENKKMNSNQTFRNYHMVYFFYFCNIFSTIIFGLTTYCARGLYEYS